MSKNSSIYVCLLEPSSRSIARKRALLRMARVNFFLLPMFHAIQFLSLIILIIAHIDGITDFFHHRIIEIQIVQYAQTHTEHFFCLQQMTDVSSTVRTAGRTLTSHFNRTHIPFKLLVEQIQFAKIGINMSMTTIPAWINAIEEIHTPVYRFQNIRRCSYSHQIGWFVLRKMWNCHIQNVIHFLMALTDGKAAHCVTIQIHLTDAFCMVNTDIVKNCALIDTEKHLIFIDGIFQANAMYTTEFDYIRSVMPMFAGVSDEEIKAQCGDAEMMGYAENKEVLDSTAPSVYFDMCDIWESLGETVNRKVAMTLFDNQYLLPLASKYSSTSTSTSKPVELTEEQKQEIVNYEALLTKSMTVEFVADTAQFKNPEEAYAIMDEFVSIANTLDGAIIQVEGNINARNYSDSGQALSAERAKAVAKYFIACGIDPNRLITVGNGNTKMVADPGSADAYLNRRTDVFFKIIEE